jgi:N-acetylmuramoyl-L-alanine amidase
MTIPTFEDIEVFARTLWGEARNQGSYGMQAIGEVIRNRVADPRWPDTFVGVCTQPKQFSCWNSADPNAELLRTVTLDDPEFKLATTVATEIVTAHYAASQLVSGANHYLTQVLFAGPNRPSWADPKKVTGYVGAHVFFKL